MNIQTSRNTQLPFDILLLFGAAFMVLVSVSPHVFPRPNIDQGVYAYIVREILDGKVPYRDLWDHKGLVIYYVYALGLILDSVYGVWLLGMFGLFLAAFLSYRLLFRLFGRTEALLGTLAWLLQPQPHTGRRRHNRIFQFTIIVRKFAPGCSVAHLRLRVLCGDDRGVGRTGVPSAPQ